MSIINNFHTMNLPQVLLHTLDGLNYTKPTPIQSQTIPIALNNSDILGSAQTGTGKTLAFTIPLIAHLLNNPNGSGLVLTPTRELAQQVATVVKKLLGSKLSIKPTLLIGGEPIFKQLSQLKSNAKIIVGTPGRVIDHLLRKTLKPNFSFLVLDETDRMFDMGFGVQLEKIISQLPKSRQTLMFSATLPANIEKLAAKYLLQPKRIAIDPVVTFVAKLSGETIKFKESEKFSTLLGQLETRTGTIIIFVKTKYSAEHLSNNLCKNNHAASAMHGDLKQSKRYRVMNDFRNGRYKIMVATDIAARGLDVPHIEHVINYDLPNCPEDYIHRVGRTARAGAEGSALNLVSCADQSKWYAIQRFISPEKYPNKSKEFSGIKNKNSKINKFSTKKKRYDNSNSKPFSFHKREKFTK
jgi:superfamily II DNA/RNA helicase